MTLKSTPRQSARRRVRIASFHREYVRRQHAYMATCTTPGTGSTALLADWLALVCPRAAAILRGEHATTHTNRSPS